LGSGSRVLVDGMPVQAYLRNVVTPLYAWEAALVCQHGNNGLLQSLWI
jgi:hypothetical protein